MQRHKGLLCLSRLYIYTHTHADQSNLMHIWSCCQVLLCGFGCSLKFMLLQVNQCRSGVNLCSGAPRRLDPCCSHLSGLHGFWRELPSQPQYWHAAQVNSSDNTDKPWLYSCQRCPVCSFNHQIILCFTCRFVGVMKWNVVWKPQTSSSFPTLRPSVGMWPRTSWKC